MMARNLMIAAAPVLVFFLIHFRYSLFHPNVLKLVQSALAGIVAAFFIILVASKLNAYLPQNSLLFDAFFKAAFLEKTGILILLLFVFRDYINFSIFEATLCGMIAGFGFSLIENMFYAVNYGSSTTIIRMLFTVPLHMTTCGLIGYYLGEMIYSNSRLYKSFFFLKAAFFSILWHGVFDYVLSQHGLMVYAASPLLLCLVVFQEIKLTKSRTIPGISVIRGLGLYYEEWQLLWRQEKYDRWIQKSMGRERGNRVDLFEWHPHVNELLFVTIFVVAAIIGVTNRVDITRYFRLTRWEEDLLLFIFPLSISATIIIVNAINKDFFKYNDLKIPIISNVSCADGSHAYETYVTYDLTVVSIFLNTFEKLGKGSDIAFEIDVPQLSTQRVEAQVVWERHETGRSPVGTLIRFTKRPKFFLLFVLMRYNIFRFVKGIVFNLRLPGFEQIKQFFTHPVSTMRDEKIYKKGEIIYNEGDSAKYFYFLKKGLVEFYKQKNHDEIITINRVADGSIFGEMSVFASTKRTSSARVVEESIVAFSDRENLHQLVKSNREFAIELFEALATRVSEVETALLEHIRGMERQKRENMKLYHSITMMVLSTIADSEVSAKVNLFEKISHIVNHLDDEIIADLVLLLKLMRKDKIGVDDVEKSIEKIYAKIKKGTSKTVV